MAAPDIDADVFRNDIAPALSSTPATTTLYASSRDKALAAAKKVNGAPRAGDSRSGLVIFKGIETIDATAADTNLFWGLRHSYIADSKELLSDLYYLIEKGLRAPQRFGLESIQAEGGLLYWKLKR